MQATTFGADSIDTLPVDQNIPSQTEVKLVDTLFKEQYTAVQKLLEGTKDVLIIGLLFVGFSLPQMDDVIQRVIPSTSSSPYILLVVKGIIFMLVYFIIKNLYLVRKK